MSIDFTIFAVGLRVDSVPGSALALKRRQKFGV
jgi:hypothetical protein